MKSRALSLAVFALVLSGCGGDDDAGADTVDEEPADGDASTDEPADGSGDEPEFSGDASSPWCLAARDIEASTDELDLVDYSDPAAIEDAFSSIVGKIEGVVGLAPDEIRADLEVSLDGFRAVNAALAEVDYNFFELDLTVLEELDESVEVANERIGRYNAEVCGIEMSDDLDDATDAPGDFDPGEGTIREQAVAELVATGFTEDEANCIFDNFDFGAGGTALEPSAMIGIFETCGIDLERIAELGG